MFTDERGQVIDSKVLFYAIKIIAILNRIYIISEVFINLQVKYVLNLKKI